MMRARRTPKDSRASRRNTLLEPRARAPVLDTNMKTSLICQSGQVTRRLELSRARSNSAETLDRFERSSGVKGAGAEQAYARRRPSDRFADPPSLDENAPAGSLPWNPAPPQSIR